MSDKSQGRIGFIGESMVELQERTRDTLHRSFAGDTLNTATYLARIQHLHHYQVYYVTALGRDPFSQAMLDQWQEENIRCDYVRRIDDKLPGMYFVELDSNGERYFHYWRNQSAAKELFSGSGFDSQLNNLTEFDYLYLSGISVAILVEQDRPKLVQLLQEAKAKGTKVVFDNNYRPKLWPELSTTRQWYERVLQQTSIACLTFDDEQAVWGDQSPAETITRCKSLGVDEVVIKRGVEPCIVDKNGESFEVAPKPIAEDRVTDTNAAGDSFAAGYLAGRLGGQSLQNSAILGHQLAGTVIQHRGAIIPKEVMPEI